MNSSAGYPVQQPSYSMLRGFVVLRVIVVTTLLLSALLIQLTFSITLPLSPIYYLAAFAYSTSILAIALLDRIRAEANAALQILGDLATITGLVYVSHGPDSGFTFLYLASVTAGAILLGRQGGLICAGLAAVFYAVLVDLMRWGVLPSIDSGDVPPRIWSRPGLVGNVALNVFAFVATALLVSAASQKLREARADVARRNAEIAGLQALHSSVLASMSSGLVTTDLEGTVTYANPAAGELLHRADSDVVGSHVLSLGLVEEASWAQVRSASSGILRFEGKRPALGVGAYFGISAATLRDGTGRARGKMLIFQNLTELKKLEGEVRLKEKMAAVGELAAGIAHEIRNPLASISGSVQALRSSVVPGSSEQRLMEIVVSESQRLSSIIEDFLKYVRPKERAIEQVDGPAALRDVVTLLQHSDELTATHRILVDLQPESVLVAADPGQLRQIFWNLARNAIAAMPDGGTIRVSARLDAERWTVSISDEGRGMTAEERDVLFTPFAHSFPGGTGLGLAIVYHIVEEHGGAIEVETAPNQGTTIRITLPQNSGVVLESSSVRKLVVAREVA
ncbi:MAG TPA: ATP-binding protein [Thermoanaerobaculia bacterium]|nr:ATP-binding protein [Thermoanaerobaculia bacterium]